MARIVWNENPPEMVECMADFVSDDWGPWDEGFESKSCMYPFGYNGSHCTLTLLTAHTLQGIRLVVMLIST